MRNPSLALPLISFPPWLEIGRLLSMNGANSPEELDAGAWFSRWWPSYWFPAAVLILRFYEMSPMGASCGDHSRFPLRRHNQDRTSRAYVAPFHSSGENRRVVSQCSVFTCVFLTRQYSPLISFIRGRFTAKTFHRYPHIIRVPLNSFNFATCWGHLARKMSHSSTPLASLAEIHH